MTVSPITSKQLSQLQTLGKVAHQRALHEVHSFDKEGVQRLLARGGEWQDYLVAGYQRFTALLPDYTSARSILGGDFVTPEEIMTARPDLAYTPEQVAQLAESIPSEDALKWCKANGYAVVAGPPRDMSLLDVRASKNTHFYSKTEGWYANSNQQFSRNDKASFGWLMVRKAPVPESKSKNWDEQTKLIVDPESVPNAVEMSWFITIFFEVRGVRLFEKVYVRTSSVDSDGDHVDVGDFVAKGLFVSNYWDGYRDAFLGVASARKF